MQIRGCSRTSGYVYYWSLGMLNFSKWSIMSNPIKTWFFELIEDAIGSKAMKQFIKEEENQKDSNSNDKAVED
mgnify:CR=1 FL=1